MVAHERPANLPPSLATGPQRPRPTTRDSWEDGQDDNIWDDVTPSVPGSNNTASEAHRHDVPAALRPGGGGALGVAAEEANVWADTRHQTGGSQHAEDASQGASVPDSLTPGMRRTETNPFLRKKVPSREANLNANPLPALPKSDSYSNMGLDDSSTNNPWQPTAYVQPQVSGNNKPFSVVPNDAASDPWAAAPARSTPDLPTKQPIAPTPPILPTLTSEGTLVWDESSYGEGTRKDSTRPPIPTAMPDELLREQQVWEDLGAPEKGKGKVTELSIGQTSQLDEWSLIDPDPYPSSSKQSGDEDGPEQKPPLPPRLSGERVRWTPSRPPVDGKAETYLVKKIKWHDPGSAENPRTSPILIQNENGPCPLVALVNALTLTTPADITDTALVQVLRSREQVSLSLLLDAVFDELMSPRRTSSEDALPDVSELYSFLQSLHTGMNVNPRFVPAEEVQAAFSRTSLTHLPAHERGDLIPGTFENTMEMSLYATFSIPLIHGWLPPREDPTYSAFERQGASYEDVQNLLFREEELEDKLSNSETGLTEAEQDLYQDIITIRIFLESAATQLTAWGIEVIGKAMRPGTFAILFRNDHFSTLYCHPHTRQLFALVTDAGYKSHGDVVWESLMDVNGEQNEFLSGDFKAATVSGTEPGSTGAASGSSGEHAGGWATLQNDRGKSRAQDDEPPMSPSTEQEDRDLALALQLQEEEDQRHREEQARRQRESVLSEQFIEQQAQQPRPINRDVSGNGAVPPRQSSISNNSFNIPVIMATQPVAAAPVRRPSATQQQVRPLVPPRRPGVTRPAANGEEPPPPTYEQAAQVPAYVPPPGHPNHPSSNPEAVVRANSNVGPGGRGQRPLGAATGGGRRPPPMSLGVPSNSSMGSHHRGDRECIVM